MTTKWIIFLSFFLFASSSIAQLPSPVEGFNIEKYMGKWNQLAAIPASFQEKCIGNTTAEYSLLDNGRVKVINSCDTKKGDRSRSEARARVNEDYGLASTLEVTFVNFFGWVWAFSGDYWVIHIEGNYETVIVGHPEFEFGWILSRKESLSVAEYYKLSDVLKDQGYDPCAFELSKTPKQNPKKDATLCSFLTR